MAYKLKALGPDGHCCCGAGRCVIQCISRGGMATLHGFPELTSPSLPPKAYLQCGFSGSIHGDVYVLQPTCSGSVAGFFDVTLSGTAKISAATGALISSGTRSVTENGGSPSSTPLTAPFTDGSDCFGSAAYSQSHGSITSTSTCCPSGLDATQIHSGTISEALSSEDTEVDAISRLPGIDVWGDYAPCTTGLCCRTTRQIRGAGQFSFEYLEARFKVLVTALPPNTNIVVRVDILRRPYGLGSYALYQTMENDGRSDSTGSAQVNFGVIDNSAGYETVASNCRAEIAS